MHENHRSVNLRRVLCALGRHRWQIERYWAISNQLAEGEVCADCRCTGRRRIVGRDFR